MSDNIWQDKAFAASAGVMSIGLIQNIIDVQKPPVFTASTVCVCLAIIAVGEWTYKPRMPLAASATVIQLGMWVILLIQRVMQ